MFLGSRKRSEKLLSSGLQLVEITALLQAEQVRGRARIPLELGERVGPIFDQTLARPEELRPRGVYRPINSSSRASAP